MTDIDKPIHRIYKKNFESIALLFWVEAQKNLVPTITMRQAVERYYEHVKEPYDLNVAIVTVSRMREAFIDLNYEKRNENTSQDCRHIKEERRVPGCCQK